MKVDSLVGDVPASTEVCLGNNSSGSDTDSTLSLDECTSIPIESSANLTVNDGLGEPTDHAEEVNRVAEGNFYSTEVAVVDNDCSSSREGLYANFNNQSSIMPTEISGEPPFGTKYSGNLECENNLVGKMVGDITLPSVDPSVENHCNTSFNDSAPDTEDKVFSPLSSSMDLSLEQRDRCALEGLDESNNNIAEDVPSAAEVSIMEDLSGENIVNPLAQADSSSINIDSLANLSLEEKVANFIQNGDLDPVEGNLNGKKKKEKKKL